MFRLLAFYLVAWWIIRFNNHPKRMKYTAFWLSQNVCFQSVCRPCDPPQCFNCNPCYAIPSKSHHPLHHPHQLRLVDRNIFLPCTDDQESFQNQEHTCIWKPLTKPSKIKCSTYHSPAHFTVPSGLREHEDGSQTWTVAFACNARTKHHIDFIKGTNTICCMIIYLFVPFSLCSCT